VSVKRLSDYVREIKKLSFVEIHNKRACAQISEVIRLENHTSDKNFKEPNKVGSFCIAAPVRLGLFETLWLGGRCYMR